MMLRNCSLSFARQPAEIIHTFQHDQISDSRLGKYVTIEPRESIGAEAVCKQVIAADALIKDSKISRSGILQQPPGKSVRPAIITVGCRSMSVGDRVSQGNDSSSIGRTVDINSA